MIIADLEFPDKCPSNCKYNNVPQGQGGICHRCPIFNCAGEDALLRPEDYRPDWAKQWKKFFITGSAPLLFLQMEDDDAKNS